MEARGRYDADVLRPRYASPFEVGQAALSSDIEADCFSVSIVCAVRSCPHRMLPMPPELDGDHGDAAGDAPG
jgi:hypothetical protein